jgi:hypothetical protein
MQRIEAEKRIKEVLKRSSDFHNVHTPFELCEEMLAKVDLKSDMKVLVMFNLEFAWLLKEKIGLENVWFMTPCELKKRAAVGMGVNENHVVKYSYNKKQIEGEKDMPKFDVVVGNPPYKQGLHLIFLNLAYNMCSKYVIFVHPSSIYLNKQPTKKAKIISILKDKINEHLKSIDLFESKKYFPEIGIIVPMSISFIDKTSKQNEITLHDHIKNKIFHYDNVDNIHIFGNNSEFISAKAKILMYASNDNLFNKNHRNKQIGNFYVNIPIIRGGLEPRKYFSDAFYTFFSTSNKVSNKSERLFFSFKTQMEANNFLNFLKTNIARFSLSLYKISFHQEGFELFGVPWLDFSQEWTDEKLYKHFNLTEEEIQFIENNIPKYY